MNVKTIVTLMPEYNVEVSIFIYLQQFCPIDVLNGVNMMYPVSY